MAQADPETGWRGRLAEMEQQLHALAADLAQDVGEPAPLPLDHEPVGAPPASPAPPPEAATSRRRPGRDHASDPRPGRLAPDSWPRGRATALAPNATLQAMCARLLASMRELMAGYELALTHVSDRPTSEAGPALTVAAGPFDSITVLQRFEDALRALPEVAEVAVRGYEGSNRAVLEVHLQGRVA